MVREVRGKGKRKCDIVGLIMLFETKHTVFHQECLTGWEEGQGHVCGGEDQIPPGGSKKESLDTIQP